MANAKLTFKTPLLPLSWVNITGQGKLKMNKDPNSTDPKDYNYTATVTYPDEEAMKKDKAIFDKFWRENKNAGLTKQNYEMFKPEMKKADFNICLTDGMLSDGHIDKDEMTRQGISITGGYVTGTKKTILEYTGSLNRWFHKSFCRPSTKELILALVGAGVMHSKNQ